MNRESIAAILNNFSWILPEVILVVVACVLFLGGTFQANRRLWGTVALIGFGIAAVALALTDRPQFDTADKARAALFSGPLWLDQMALLVKAIALVGGALLVMFNWDEVPDEQAAEFHACLLLIAAGLGLTAMANDLVLLFLALELTSIPMYVLLYLPRSDDAAREAGMKYFLLSVFSSAIMLFGFSYLYGLAGTTNIQGIVNALTVTPTDSAESTPGTVLIAIVMVVAGLGFRITAVPFHFYAPDVYQGTTTGVAATLSFVPKVAGFAALIRVFGFLPFKITAQGEPIEWAEPIAGAQLSTLLWIVAAVTMTLGNVLALLQDNVKRMLAYSSVAHAGYMLIGLAAAPHLLRIKSQATNGVDAILVYLVAYGAMTIGAFAVLSHLSTQDRPAESVDDLAGLAKSHPGIALMMALFLFSLIGLPATAGFIGKWMLFLGAFSVQDTAQSDHASLFRILAIIAAVNAAIGGWYYLRIIAVMFLRTPLRPLAKKRMSPCMVTVWACAVLTLAIGTVGSWPMIQRASEASKNEIEIVTKK